MAFIQHAGKGIVCRYVLLVLLFAVAGKARAGHAQADSILKIVLSVKDRDARMQALYDTCTRRYSDEPQKAILFAKAFFSENQQKPNDTNTAKANYLMGDVTMLAGNYDESLKYCLTALSLARRNNMYSLQVEVLSDIAGIYLRTNDAPRSLETMREALSIAREHHYPVQEARMMSALSVRYAMTERYEEAILIADSAMQKARALHLPKLVESILENKAIFYRISGQLDKALASLQAALPLADSLGIRNMKAGLLYHLSNQYLEMHRLQESEQTAHDALNVSGDVDDPAFIIALKELLSNIAKQKGDYKTAYEYLQQSVLLKDSVFTEAKSEQIQELQTRYDTDMKNKQLAAQSAQISFNKKVNFFLWISSALLFMVGLLIYLNQRRTRRLNIKISRQREELQHKTQELEHLNRVKDRLFSTISHDMRTPVNSLLSFTMLLDQGTIPPEKLALYAGELKNNLHFTAGLMENLLNFARSQMHGYQPRMETTDIEAIVKDTLSLTAIVAERKGITIRNDIQPGTLVLGDINMLSLVARNLISNAIKFTPRGGMVTLSATVTEPGFITLQVADNGIGIEAEQVNAFNRNTDPNDQPLDNMPGTDNEKSTGLGLLLVKNFLVLMGGKISLESEAGKGSVFNVCLLSAS